MAIRVRCPCCGHVVNGQRLKQDYEVEIFWTTTASKPGKMGGWIWEKPKIAGEKHLKQAMLEKLRRIVAKLEIEALGFEMTEQSVLTTSASLLSRKPTELWLSPTIQISAPATRQTVKSSTLSFQVPSVVKVSG
jgi:hypothetical protein